MCEQVCASPIAYVKTRNGTRFQTTRRRAFHQPVRLRRDILRLALARHAFAAALLGNWRDYLRGRESVSLKKYLYVFRPPFGRLRALSLSKRLLACRWIERQLGQVPMLFAHLVESVLDEADVRLALAELVARKQAGEELAVAPPVPALMRFIEAELPRLEALNEADDAAGEVEELNGFFRRYALAV